MAAPERFAKRQIPLAPRAPSIHGPERRLLRESERAPPSVQTAQWWRGFPDRWRWGINAGALLGHHRRGAGSPGSRPQARQGSRFRARGSARPRLLRPRPLPSPQPLPLFRSPIPAPTTNVERAPSRCAGYCLTSAPTAQKRAARSRATGPAEIATSPVAMQALTTRSKMWRKTSLSRNRWSLFSEKVE